MKNNKKIMLLSSAALIMNFALASISEAAGVQVKCETRDAKRSKISVAANNVKPGNYFSVVTSGPNAATSDVFPAIGDEVEFDFDSNQADIAAGAEPISKTFIRNNRVSGQVFKQNGVAIAPIVTVLCKTR